MRVESMDEDIRIFIHNFYFNNIDWHDKLEIETNIRDILNKICNNYKIKLKGFYRIKIYPHNIGTFIEVIKIDDDNYDGCEVDFRIVVIFNKEMYLKLDDYYYFIEYEKLYYDGYYYINLDDIDDYLNIIDFGDIVFDDEINFNKAIIIKKNKTT